MTNHEHGAWHREVIPASTEATLDALRDARLLDRFYLAGGTGLALQLGHRLSLDLDFFAEDHFNEEALLQHVQTLAGFALVAKALHAPRHGPGNQSQLSRLCLPDALPTNRSSTSPSPIRATSRA